MPKLPLTFVFAGNYEQFRTWCRENDRDHWEHDVIYVSDWMAFLGREVTEEDTLIYYGTFWELRDCLQIQR